MRGYAPNDPRLVTTYANGPLFFNSDASNVVDHQFYQPSGPDGGSATEAEVQMIIPVAGILRDLWVGVSAAAGGGASHDATVRVDGVDTALTVNLGAAETIESDITNEVAVTAGQLLSIQWHRTGGPNAAYMRGGMNLRSLVTI